MEFFTISLLNGVSYGLLLFMLSSGLTLIFSMMGVLNFATPASTCWARTSPTDLGVVGFWPALSWRPAGGPAGRAVRALCLRRVHKFGHVPSCWSPSACPT
jgi:branched-chain amino acid transport system permease protein